MTVTFKNIELVEEEKFAYLKISGKLEKEDYEFFVPELEQQIERYGKLNMVLELDNFSGWTAGAAWEDTKFGIRHFNDIERLAIIGDNSWERGMAAFAKVFIMAKVRYFDANKEGEIGAAERWVREGGKTKVA